MVPNGSVFGYLIEIGELIIGVALMAAAAMWLFRWQRLDLRARSVVLLGTAIAAAGGLLMNINFHLANGSAHPWLIPSSGFDEGVDLDSLMPAIQIVLIAVSVGVSGWRCVRQKGPDLPKQRSRTGQCPTAECVTAPTGPKHPGDPTACIDRHLRGVFIS